MNEHDKFGFKTTIEIEQNQYRSWKGQTFVEFKPGVALRLRQCAILTHQGQDAEPRRLACRPSHGSTGDIGSWVQSARDHAQELQIEIVQNGLSIPSRSLEKLPLSHFEVMTETVAKFAGIAVRLPILSVFSREWRSRGWANKRLY